MAYETGLMIVNDIQDQMAILARRVVVALKDGRITPLEGFGLSFPALQFGQAVAALLTETDAAVHKEVLYVLEHMDIVLPEEE